MIRPRVLLVVASALSMAVLAAIPLAEAAPTSTPASDVRTSAGPHLQFLGTRNVSQIAAIARASHATSPEGVHSPNDVAQFAPRPTHPGGAAVVRPMGQPAPLPVVGRGAAQAYDGIDHTDSRLAYNGNAYNGEPPDGDICAGTGAEVEILNSALQFFDTRGNVLTPPIADNQFMGLPPEKDRSVTPNTFPGPANSDINCAYDSTTKRFFLTTWGLDQFLHGGFTGTQAFYIAAQATSNPVGDYYVYKLPIEPPTDKVCAGFCAADYPQTSTDANSFILTYNRFTHDESVFDGGRILVMSKQSLLSGHRGPVLSINPGRIGSTLIGPFLGAQVVPGSPELTANGGTHYLVSTLDPNGAGDNRIGVVALTNTSAIDSGVPSNIHVRKTLVSGVLGYANPPKLQQKPGPRPLGTNLSTQVPGAPDEPLRRLDGGDDRAQPTKFADGQIWTLIDTKLADGTTGLIWLTLRPSLTPSTFTAAITRQHYVAVATNNLDYGDITPSADGSKALIVASLVGPTMFPSAAYTTFTSSTFPTEVHVYKAGVRPEDGFSCYNAFGAGDASRGCRWGDYSMTTTSPSGVFWFETEYITPRLRMPLANWGTAIGRLPASKVSG